MCFVLGVDFFLRGLSPREYLFQSLFVCQARRRGRSCSRMIVSETRFRIQREPRLVRKLTLAGVPRGSFVVLTGRSREVSDRGAGAEQRRSGGGCSRERRRGSGDEALAALMLAEAALPRREVLRVGYLRSGNCSLQRRFIIRTKKVCCERLGFLGQFVDQAIRRCPFLFACVCVRVCLFCLSSLRDKKSHF